MSAPVHLPYNRQNATASGIATDNAPHIAGNTILTTGVSPGGTGAIFLETIARHQPKLLILAGRNPTKVQATADKISKIHENAGVQVRVLMLTVDFASQASVRKAAAEVLAWHHVPAIDVVVNSAGIMAGPYRTTEDGIEAQFRL